MSAVQTFLTWSEAVRPALRAAGFRVAVSEDSRFGDQRAQLQLESPKYLARVTGHRHGNLFDFHIIDIETERDVMNAHATGLTAANKQLGVLLDRIGVSSSRGRQDLPLVAKASRPKHLTKRRIPEPDLVIPTLELLYGAPDGELKTTEIINALSAQFRPEGEDAEISEKRWDTRFSQKLRNLKSHKTLVKAGFATEIYRGFKITPAGRRLVDSLRR
jgi:hypothetical protein